MPKPLTVEDVYRAPALQLVLLAGADGLDRRVSWAHVSELPDPTPWLLGAELIMTTGMAVPRAARAQAAYVHRLDDAGVSALAVSAHLHAPPLSAAMHHAADERGFPVFEVPLSVPFVAIAQEVAAAAGTGDGQRLGAQLQVFGALRWMTEENLSTAELFERLERLSGYRLSACTAQGRPLLPGVPVPDEVPALPRASGQAPPTVAGGFVLPVPAPGETAGYLVARAQAGARPGGLAVVQHIATVAALQLTMLRNRRETARRQGAETLAEMLDDRLDPVTARRRLVRSGIEPGLTLVLALAVAADPDDAPDDLPLVRALESAELPHLLLRRERELVLLAPAGAATLAALDGQAGLVIGASSPFDVAGSLELPRREARWARARAADTGRRSLFYDADDSAGRWLPQDLGALRALVDRVLGAAIGYDAEHHVGLVATVGTWLRHDRRAEPTAEALHIHVNTLAYRLRRFAEVSGFDLAGTSALAEVWLAVRALDHIGAEAALPARGPSF